MARVRAAAGPQCAPAVVADDVVELPGVAAEDPHAARAKTVTATSSRRLTQATVGTAMFAGK